jgi:hypothetical protein
MPRELLRLPCPEAELVLLKYPDDHYQIDIYWLKHCYYEHLQQTNTLDSALEVLILAESLWPAIYKAL